MPAGAATYPLSEILTAAAQEIRDDEYGRLGRPFYVSAAQRALGAMNKRTSFFKKVDVLQIPENLVVTLPKDLTEKDDIYLFSGDECNIGIAPTLWIKPNAFHFGGTGYVAHNKGIADPLTWWNGWEFPVNFAPLNCLYFAGEFNGTLKLSQSCSQFTSLLLLYTGLGVNCFGEDFDVPEWCREAITDWVIHRAACALEREDPQFLGRLIARKEAELKTPQGSWATAIWDYKRMDKKERYDNTVYNTRFGRWG